MPKPSAETISSVGGVGKMKNRAQHRRHDRKRLAGNEHDDGEKEKQAENQPGTRPSGTLECLPALGLDGLFSVRQTSSKP